MSPACLSIIELPPPLRGGESRGVVFSGRGPIWLFGRLVHLAHPFAWVGVHDPRLGGAVVVQRHRPDSPEVGTVVAVSWPPA